MRILQAGATSQTIYLLIVSSSTGAPLSGLAYNTASLTAYYAINGAGSNVISLVTQTASGAYSSGGFCAVDGTNMPGLYRLDLPAAAIASGTSTYIYLQGAAGMLGVCEEIMLVPWNPQDAVRLGLTALPNANAAASGGLLTFGTSAGQINPNGSGLVPATLNATNVTGDIAANVLQWNTVSAGSLPTNFGSLLVNGSGFVTYANAAPPTVSAIASAILATPANLLATNASGFVTYSNAAPPSTASIAAAILVTPANLLATNASGQVTFSNTSIATVTGNVNGSVGSVVGAVGSVTGSVGSVVGAVGSVTGAVGSVTGAVGSVTGAVGSVTGNIDGNVVGSVGSISGVTFPSVVPSQAQITGGAYALDTDGSGRMTIIPNQSVNTNQFGGVGVTGRDIGASVLLSPGTGTGQVNLTSGRPGVNWADILNPTTVVGLTNTSILDATAVETAITNQTSTLETAIINATSPLATEVEAAAIKAKTDLLTFTGSNIQSIVEAYATGQDPATWTWNALLASFDMANTFGEFVQNISGGGGGGSLSITSAIPGIATAGQLGAVLQYINNQVALLTGVAVSIIGPILNSGQLVLTQNWQYPVITIPIANPNLSGLTILVNLIVGDDVILPLSTGATVVNPGMANQQIQFSLTSAQTLALPTGPFTYTVSYVSGGGNVVVAEAAALVNQRGL